MTALVGVVSAEPLDLSTHLAAVQSVRFGAVATFIGQVRDHDPDVDGDVVALHYTAHPDAEHVLTEIIARFIPGSDGQEVSIAASHRIGELAVGDIALVACVASPHRAAAFDVCRDLVEAIKAELPIWKRQEAADGSHNWVGLPRG